MSSLTPPVPTGRRERLARPLALSKGTLRAISHRDHRAMRTVRRAFLLIVGTVALVGGLAVLSPFPLAGFVALVALALVGGLYLRNSDRLLRTYAHDLRSVRGDEPPRGWVRVEVESEVALERAVGLPSQRSPHTRFPGGRGVSIAPNDSAY
ncbi:MAG: hypothetical protein L3K10_07585 [Thermoplasmata archaeon]|nr:hypothetical protein [Thermoplasmata archaeon]